VYLYEIGSENVAAGSRIELQKASHLYAMGGDLWAIERWTMTSDRNHQFAGYLLPLHSIVAQDKEAWLKPKKSIQ
jgi:hypothetical protein